MRLVCSHAYDQLPPLPHGKNKRFIHFPYPLSKARNQSLPTSLCPQGVSEDQRPHGAPAAKGRDTMDSTCDPH